MRRLDPLSDDPIFEYSSIEPYASMRRRIRTGQTPPPPPPPISPLGTPPDYTPSPPKPPPYRSLYSPPRYPGEIPPFNVRKVQTPPAEIMSPYYYHSTPKSPVRYEERHLPEHAGRLERKKKRQKALDEMYTPYSNRWLILTSPVRNRQDVDSLFGEKSIPFTTPPNKGSPQHDRFETPPRSPGLEIMRQEIKKNNERTKYELWYNANAVKAEWRNWVMRHIKWLLSPSIELHKMERMDVHQAIAMLRHHLKVITDKHLSQNLELPPIAKDSPALSLIEQKQISIRRIIKEFKDENFSLEINLRWLKNDIKRMIESLSDPKTLQFHAKYKAELTRLQDMEKRAQRMKQTEGFCMRRCPTRKMLREWNGLAAPLEKKYGILRRKYAEIVSEFMKANVDTLQFADYVTPHFLDKFSQYLKRLCNLGVPDEVYEAAADDVSTHLRRIFKEKRQEWVEVNREINTLYHPIQDQVAESELIKKDIEACKKQKTKLDLEYKKNRSETGILEWMIQDARLALEFKEQSYASTYQAIIRLKRKTVELQKQLGMTPSGPPELLPEAGSARTTSPIITSPQSPEETIGSPAHDSSPVSRFGQSQHGTSVAPDSIGVSSRRRSPISERIPQSETGSDDFLGDEPLPDEMLNISGLGSSGGQSELDDLGSARPPSGMFNISGLQGSGFSPSPIDSLERSKSPFDSLEGSGSSAKKSFVNPSPSRKEQLQMDLGCERPPSGMFNISGLQESGFSPSPIDSLERSKSPFDSLEGSGSSAKKSFVIPSPGRKEQLQMDIEIIPRAIRRSPSGQGVVCDLAVEMQEAPRRELEKRKYVVRGTPPASQTVGRRFDRIYGKFTPQSSFKRHHVSARGPLFEGDFESPESPWGTGRKTHPELMDLTMRAPTPPSRQLDRTIEWEMNHEMK